MITRTSLADEIDLLDADIKVLNDSKTAAFTAYREQLIAAGVAKENVKKEIDATKAAIKRRRATTKDEDAVLENEALADEIYIEITAKSRAPRACVENIDEFDAETGEIIENRQAEIEKRGLAGALGAVLGMDVEIVREDRSDAGLNIVTKHTEITASSAEAAVTADDDLREPVAAEQGQIIREGDAPHETDRFGGDASCPDTEFQMDRATEGSFETGSEAAEKGRKATATVAAPADLNHAGAGESPAADQPLTGGDHEVGIARDPLVTGEGAASALPAKPKFVLRPHCRNPGETCGGYGRKHCRACEMAAAELEEVA